MAKKKIEQPTAHPTVLVPVGDLRPHPRNYKKHPAEQIRHLVASLRQYGQFRNVVIARDSTILAGHGVVEAIKKVGWAEVTCVRLDLDPASPKALKLVALDNELPKFGTTDEQALFSLLRDVARMDEVDGLLGTGFDAIESGDPTFGPGTQGEQGSLDRLSDRCSTCGGRISKK